MNAIILAGGLGTRLRSMVKEHPKCMAEVGGRPFLSYLLDWLKGKDIEKVILSVGYLRDHIFKWVDAHRKEYPFDILYAIEDYPLGTGGGIRLALDQTDGDKVLILNGDTFFDVDIKKMGNSSAGICLALKPMTDFDRYGSVDIAENNVIRQFNEKKHCKRGLINGGVYLLNKNLIDLSRMPEAFSFEKEILEPQTGTGLLEGIVCDGYFIDIGIPPDYIKAELHWGNYDTLLLDRDGVINKLRPGDYVKTWAEFEFIPEFLKAIPEWTRKFKHIFIVTNQRGVGKGLMSLSSLKDIHKRMIEKIKEHGGFIERIYCCTATEESDHHRKPSIGMFEDILKDYPDIDRKKTVMVGDKDSDMEFASNAGIRGLKLIWQ